MSFANNAATTLLADITNSATTLTVQSGAGALFPTLTGSQYFYCTLENSSGSSREIVKVTARSTDTFTIVRGQDGTSGTAFVLGSKVELRLVRANLQDFALLDEANTFTQQQTVSSGIKFGDGTTQTTAPVVIKGLGLSGETWHDVTSSRALSTTYTNSNSYPIMVSVNCQGNGVVTVYAELTINGIIIATNYVVVGGGVGESVVSNVVGIVPVGATYSARGSTALTSWIELY